VEFLKKSRSEFECISSSVPRGASKGVLTMTRMAHLIFSGFGLVLSFSSILQAQQWELGAQFGLGVSHDPAITNSSGSAQPSFRTAPALSVVCTENSYQYFSGEFRYLFRWGGPKLTSDGAHGSMDGFSNVITYEILIHLTPRESRLRPFFAGGVGMKAYTGTSPPSVSQSLADVALLRPITQVEPAVSAGGGLKYRLARDVQLRIDFRTYMTPLPNDLVRPVGKAVVHGWSFDFVPMVGFSYIF